MLLIKINDLFLAQLKPRPFHPTVIHGVRAFLFVDNDNDWRIFHDSEVYPMNVVFDKKFTHEIEKIELKLPIQNIKRDSNYSIGLEILEFYDGILGTSNTLTDINVKIE